MRNICNSTATAALRERLRASCCLYAFCVCACCCEGTFVCSFVREQRYKNAQISIEKTRRICGFPTRTNKGSILTLFLSTLTALCCVHLLVLRPLYLRSVCAITVVRLLRNNSFTFLSILLCCRLGPVTCVDYL